MTGPTTLILTQKEITVNAVQKAEALFALHIVNQTLCEVLVRAVETRPQGTRATGERHQGNPKNYTQVRSIHSGHPLRCPGVSLSLKRR